jgi:hypothetical protein
MSMDLDKDDLAVLCTGMTKDEVDRLHRLLHEWSVGPEDNFPVQLALLTKAQWRIAASLPRTMEDSRKLIELHLAEYRRQTKTVTDDFSSAAQIQTDELKNAVELHAKITQLAAEQIQVRLNDAETVGRRLKSLMETAASDWNDIKASTTTECHRLQQVSNDLQDRFAWRVMLRSVAVFLLALGYGIFIGHYWTR